MSLGGDIVSLKDEKKLSNGENQHIKMIDLPPNLNFVLKNSPAGVNSIQVGV